MLSTMEGWPDEIETGLIPTDNAMGVMTRELSPAARAFVELAAAARRPLLEIGAAYGNATLPALAAGATVIANDLSASELNVLASVTPEEHLRRLILAPARFPDELHFADRSLSGVLASQVIHFLDGPAVERAFHNVQRWLEHGGAFFILVMSPSLSYYSKLRPDFEDRARLGERWPGIFNPRHVATPEWKDRLPEMVHLFEKDILRRCAEEAHLVVEHLEYFCFENFPDQHRTDGREYISLVARKP